MMFAQFWARISGRVALGIAGLSFGVASFILAGYALVEMLSNPDYLLALYWAIMHTRSHHVTNADRYVFAQLVGGIMQVGGTFSLALLLAYFGVPLRIKPVPVSDGAISPQPKGSIQ